MMRTYSAYKILICTVFVLLCTSCGLEIFYDIKPPHGAVPQNPADGVTTDNLVSTAETCKFEFFSVANTAFISPGTEVYYRIYDSIEKLQADAKKINAVNTDVSADGFYKLQSLNYRRLRTEHNGTKQDLLIQDAHRVVIRLVDEAGLNSGVFYDGASAAVFPLLLRDRDFLFYFKSAPSEQLRTPQAGDPDFDFSGTASDAYYVNAYAVSVGLVSSTWTRSVSKVLPLGFSVFKKAG